MSKKYRIDWKIDDTAIASNATSQDNKSWQLTFRSDCSAYTILHELGHCLSGYGCCREHDEYIAHGIAIGLANIYKIDFDDPPNVYIDSYAGKFNHGCLSIKSNNIKLETDKNETEIKFENT